MDDCIFCRIAAKVIPSDIVLEDDDFVAFRDAQPKALQHVLVVPREHIASLNDLEHRPEGMGDALMRFIVKLAKELGIDESGYRALTNVGPDGGQEVQHLHFHVLGGENLGDVR
ncbi:MAG: histidine triad nucleotide-binding protein [Actinobacteria bacterium]|jgi:histidine triad (HIT) family protein|nr:histidine triad nucleotide-binding protein [Actinomycetota bacterium]